MPTIYVLVGREHLCRSFVFVRTSLQPPLIICIYGLSFFITATTNGFITACGIWMPLCTQYAYEYLVSTWIYLWHQCYFSFFSQSMIQITKSWTWGCWKVRYILNTSWGYHEKSTIDLEKKFTMHKKQGWYLFGTTYSLIFL